MSAWTYSDQKRLGSIGRKLRNEPPVKSCILLRGHVSAATPRFIADSPKPHAEGLRISVLRPFACQGDGARRGVAIGHPIMELLRRARRHVCGEVRFGPAEPAQMHEFVNTELVGLGIIEAFRHACLPIVVRTGALCRVPDAIPPVVAVCKTAAGPAKVGRSNALHVINELLTDAVDIRNFRTPSGPDAVVNDAAEMLNKLTV